MTFQNILTTRPFDGVQSTLQQLLADYAEWRRMRATYDQTWRELSAMSDRERADIGILSSDIPQVASEAAAMSRRAS